jgi:3-isopropylmalate/(R)-2-methylmalate dehydratase small subunit
MAGFGSHTGRIAVYDADQVDTDRIIPARFLSMVTRSGYGELLFHDVRGPDFPLDRPEAQGASVLVAGANFGCGSSREHAVWAVQQAGFRAVVGKKTDADEAFSDIFRSNAANCGLLLVPLAEADHRRLVAAGSGAEVTIDLPAQTLALGGESFSFPIAEAAKRQLLAGLDLVGTTLELEGQIAEFERRWDAFAPKPVPS